VQDNGIPPDEKPYADLFRSIDEIFPLDNFAPSIRFSGEDLGVEKIGDLRNKTPATSE
jgi:hypothetical protein